MIHSLRLSFTIVCLSIACQQKQAIPDGKPLVAVDGEILYAHEIPELSGLSADSVTATNRYMEQWIRDQLVLQQARSTVTDRSDIDRMVNDYRNQLLTSAYEQYTVDQQMDMRITDDELQSYYEENKDYYQLSDDLIKIIFVDVPKQYSQLTAVRRAWKSDNWGKLKRLSQSDSIQAYFGQKEWLEKQALRTMLPEKVITSRTLKKDLKFEANLEQRQYFVKIWDIVKVDEQPPMAYLQEKMSRVILHKRKVELLNALREELYEKVLNNGEITMYPPKQN